MKCSQLLAWEYSTALCNLSGGNVYSGAVCEGGGGCAESRAGAKHNARRKPSRATRMLLAHPPFAQFVERHRQDDYGSDDHLLPVWIGPEQVAAIGKQPHNECAYQGPQHTAFASPQAASADYYRGDSCELVAGPAGRLAGHQAGGLNHSSESRPQAGNGVD